MAQETYLPHEYNILAFAVLILAAITVILTCVHSKNAFQDLRTSNRKCLAHRVHKPETTKAYRINVYTTLIALYSMTFTLIFTAIEYNFNSENCVMAYAVCEKLSFFTSKAALYMLYILRLDYLWGNNDNYGWSQNVLKRCGFLVIISAIILFFYTTLNIVWYPTYIHDTNLASFPYYCQIIPETPMVVIAGFGILLYDLVCSVLCIIAFVVPLNQLKEEVKKSNLTTFQHKMNYPLSHYRVLVVVGSTTTLMWIALLFTGRMFWATLMINLDFLINSVVICLMSPYYPHDKYFERLCYFCMLCCGDGKRYQSAVTRRNLFDGMEESLDTSSIFQQDHLDELLARRDDSNDERAQLNANQSDAGMKSQ